MFATETLPGTLRVLEQGKMGIRWEGTVLFVEARHLYRQIDRTHRDWSKAQSGFIANILRHEELEGLNANAQELEATIAANLAGLLEA